MTYHYKARVIHRRYKTRKDFYHTSKGFFMSYYPKKYWRKQANLSLRRYEGDVGDNSWYKKFHEVMWIVV